MPKLKGGFESGSFHLGGWKAQLQRARRWRRRMKGENLNLEDIFDFSSAFFLACFQMSEWLRKDERLNLKSKVDRLAKDNGTYKICRDLANSSKHGALTKPSIDANPSWNLNYDSNTEKVSWVVLIDGKGALDVQKLADDCLDMWETFLKKEKLI